MEGSCRNRNRPIQVEHASTVLCRIQQELLTIEIADLGMGLHHNPRTCPVYSALPGSAQAGNTAVRQLIGVFAEVPDVSLLVLSEPIERVFGEFTVDENLVVHFDA